MSGGDSSSGDELKLLGLWASPFVLRVKLALSLKGLSYEYIEEDLDNKSQRLLSYNPVHKKVPVLLHNGKPICESQIIVQYLDEAFCAATAAGPSLLPADPYDRATARFWAAYIDDELMASWIKSIRGKTAEEKAEGLEQMFMAVETLEAAFKEISEGGKKPFFGGDDVGYLDVTLGAVVGWMPASAVLYGMRLFDATRSPLLDAWAARFTALDAVSAVVPDVDSLVEYGKMREVEIAAAAAAAGN